MRINPGQPSALPAKESTFSSCLLFEKANIANKIRQEGRRAGRQEVKAEGRRQKAKIRKKT